MKTKRYCARPVLPGRISVLVVSGSSVTLSDVARFKVYRELAVKQFIADRGLRV